MLVSSENLSSILNQTNNFRKETRSVSKSISIWTPDLKKINHSPKKSEMQHVLKLGRHQIVLAQNQNKIWACKVIAIFIKHNDLRLSSTRQLELSLLHPDVLIRKMLLFSKAKKMYSAATKIQRAFRLFKESRRRKKGDDKFSNAATFIQNVLRQYLAQKKLAAEKKRKNQQAILI